MAKTASSPFHPLFNLIISYPWLGYGAAYPKGWGNKDCVSYGIYRIPIERNATRTRDIFRNQLKGVTRNHAK